MFFSSKVDSQAVCELHYGKIVVNCGKNYLVQL